MIGIYVHAMGTGVAAKGTVAQATALTVLLATDIRGLFTTNLSTLTCGKGNVADLCDLAELRLK